jgi:DNA-binding transcriptional regulator GbsR (MarR family)
MQALSEAIRGYVNDTGLLLEKAGFPRIAGQLLGWLQVCETETQSLSDVVSALGISRASASTSARLLEQIGLVERVILSGDRRDFYRISRDGWHRFMQTRIETMRHLRRNADHGLRVLEGEPAKRRQRLERMRRLYSFLEREIPRLLQQFEVEETGGKRSYSAEVEFTGQA